MICKVYFILNVFIKKKKKMNNFNLIKIFNDIDNNNNKYKNIFNNLNEKTLINLDNFSKFIKNKSQNLNETQKINFNLIKNNNNFNLINNYQITFRKKKKN